MTNFQLFNLNGVIGNGAYSKPDFPRANDFIAHMDYLGIDRSLVWHQQAYDLNATLGNKRLLQEISDSQYEERLIPVLLINPATFFETGALEFIKQQLISQRTHALKVIPHPVHFPLRQIERVLQELKDFSPLLLWDSTTGPADDCFQAIENLATQFPTINVAITHKMWPGYGAILDIMYRCPNVYTDISCMHMWNYLELITEHFGAERLLFGIGSKAHYGAAVALLAHANITNQQRRLIAHGNLERLLHIQPLTNRLTNSLSILQHKPIWLEFCNGQPLNNLNVIDAHTHSGPPLNGLFSKYGCSSSYAQSLLDQMKQTGVNKMLICSNEALFGDCPEGNKQLQQDLIPFGNTFSGYLVFNPLYQTELAPELDNFFADNFFIGFKILPSYWKIAVTDHGYEPMWQFANKHCLPILIHTWNDQYNSPSMLKYIVKSYPNAIFILGHSGGGTAGRREAVQLTNDNSNVYLEFCGSFTSPEPYDKLIQQVGINKIIFGSDTGCHSQAWELGRFLSMPLPDNDLRPALATTIETILNQRKTNLTREVNHEI